MRLDSDVRDTTTFSTITKERLKCSDNFYNENKIEVSDGCHRGPHGTSGFIIRGRFLLYQELNVLKGVYTPVSIQKRKQQKNEVYLHKC